MAEQISGRWGRQQNNIITWLYEPQEVTANSSSPHRWRDCTHRRCHSSATDPNTDTWYPTMALSVESRWSMGGSVSVRNLIITFLQLLPFVFLVPSHHTQTTTTTTTTKRNGPSSSFVPLSFHKLVCSFHHSCSNHFLSLFSVSSSSSFFFFFWFSFYWGFMLLL